MPILRHIQADDSNCTSGIWCTGEYGAPDSPSVPGAPNVFGAPGASGRPDACSTPGVSGEQLPSEISGLSGELQGDFFLQATVAAVAWVPCSPRLLAAGTTLKNTGFIQVALNLFYLFCICIFVFLYLRAPH